MIGASCRVPNGSSGRASSGNQAEVNSWLTIIQGAGFSADQSIIDAYNTVIEDLTNDGIWNKIEHFNLLAADQFGGILYPMKGGATITNVNFVNGDYSLAGGLTGNGTSKYLNLGFQMTNPATGHIGVYQRTTLSSGGRVLIGSSDGTHRFAIIQNSGAPAHTGTWGTTAGVTSVIGSFPNGLAVLDRAAATDLELYINGVEVSERTSSVTPATNGLNMFLFAQNTSGSPSSYCDNSLCGYWAGATLTPAEHVLMTTRIEAFMDALGRGAV